MRSSLLLLSSAALLAGCPSDSPTFVDAPVNLLDAATDANIGAATITVNREQNEPGTGEPIGELEVFFIRPDGTYEIVSTGPDGRATAQVVPGSAIVTAHQRTFSGVASYFLTAYVGVGPGFDVIAGARAPSLAGIAGNVSVSWPPVSLATRYQIASSCGYGFIKGTAASVEVEEGCAAGTNGTVLVTAYDNTGPIAYSVRSGVDLVAAIGGPSITMPAFTTTLPSAMVTYSGVPAGFDDVELLLELHQDGRTFGELEGRFAIASNPVVTAPIVPVGSTTAIRSRFNTGAKGLAMYHLRHHATRQLAHTLDVGAGMLPAVTFPSFDPATRTLTWQESTAGAGGRPDTIVSRGYWETAVGGSVDFTIVGPAVAGVTSAVLPALPAELADLTPGRSGQRLDQRILDDRRGGQGLPGGRHRRRARVRPHLLRRDRVRRRARGVVHGHLAAVAVVWLIPDRAAARSSRNVANLDKRPRGWRISFTLERCPASTGHNGCRPECSMMRFAPVLLILLAACPGNTGDDTADDDDDGGGIDAPPAPPGLPLLDLSAGSEHTCAVLDDRTARCWGDNREGQLGDGTTTPSVRPVAVWASPASARSPPATSTAAPCWRTAPRAAGARTPTVSSATAPRSTARPR